MFIKNWKKEIFTIPNILSFFRLILIPVYVTIYLTAREATDYLLAAAILAVSCLTDLIDGKIARHFNMVSTLGKIIDPLADKATQFSLIICLTSQYPILWCLVGLFVVKEGFQLDYLNVEYNIEEANKKISDIMDRAKILNMEDSILELKVLHEYFDGLFNDFEKERINRKSYEETGKAFAKKLIIEALEGNNYPTKERLWEINTLYQRNEGALFANQRAMLIGAVNMSKEDNDFLFRNRIVFKDDEEEENKKVISTLIKGVIKKEFSFYGFKNLVKGFINGSKLEKLYKKYPENPIDYFNWKKKADKLWNKVGTMADTAIDL
jgi:hypothetical protein